MSAIPRYRAGHGPALLSAGFRPFFLFAALWAAIAVPLWLAMFAGAAPSPAALPASVWHGHEMVFGYGGAVVAGFLLTAVPNWTGRMPLQGGPLAALVLLWLAGRLACLAPSNPFAALADLAFPLAFLLVIAREVLAGRNWRNLPVVVALSLLLVANVLVHAGASGWLADAALGNRLGIATLAMLISLIGGRIVPSFTRNWLARMRPAVAPPASFGAMDRAALLLTGFALLIWVAAPTARLLAPVAILAGLAQWVRLWRWRGAAAWREPLLIVLHLGYGWLGAGLLLLGLPVFFPALPASVALHALTVGAIGTMTLAVMTRATLGHTGQKLTAGSGTVAIFALITLAALARLAAPFAGGHVLPVLVLAGTAWSGAFSLFALLYGRLLITPR